MQQRIFTSPRSISISNIPQSTFVEREQGFVATSPRILPSETLQEIFLTCVEALIKQKSKCELMTPSRIPETVRGLTMC
jgi:hypothetical protein